MSTQVTVSDAALRKAAGDGVDEFLEVIVQALLDSIGHEITAESMASLNTSQLGLLAYDALRAEVMDGGFVQLIHNGWGGFIFINPFDRLMREWGLDDLCSLVRKAHKLYNMYKADIERDCSDEAFMALYERFPDFDTVDDLFVENEEDFTHAIAHYVDEHLADFVTITDK